MFIGAFGAGAIPAGFLHLFALAIPIPWSAPFGGLPVIGVLAALAQWLYASHIVLLCGFRVTVVFDEAFAA